MRKPETKIDIQCIPDAIRYDDFAISVRRERSQICYAVRHGQLNWGKANGVKMIIIDDLSQAYIEQCRANDNKKHKIKQ